MNRPADPGGDPPGCPEGAPPGNPPGPAADPLTGRLTLRLDDLAASLGVSRRSLERERSAGRLPKPDVTIGRMPLWRLETIRAWLAKGGRP